MFLSFNVEKQIITRIDTERVVTNSMNYLYARFTFSEEWTGEKTAVFKGKDKTYNALLDENDTCLVPWEVLTESRFDVSVFCGFLITANKITIYTVPSGYEIGDESRVPTPDVFTQIIEMIDGIDAESVPYDNTQSGMSAENVQEALDELAAGGGGSDVEVTQIQSTGTKIATITVDGDATDLYAPDGGGGASSLSDLSDTSISSPQSGDVLVYDGEKWENEILDGFEREKIYTPIAIQVITGKYVSRFDGSLVNDGSSWYCEVSVNSGECYRVVGTHYSNLALYAFYDNSDNFISAWPTTSVGTTNSAVDVVVPNNAAIMRCSGLNWGKQVLKVYSVSDSNTYKLLPVHDILYGKKWFACGDSFTAGDFTGYRDSEGHTNTASDAFDPLNNEWKTYPYWIGKRTGIIYDDTTCAAGGIGFTNISGATNPFSSTSSSRNYTKIPADCDYITLQFGLNEIGLTAEQIGTNADTTNETLWGAYYTVLNSILTANPTVKIGIIITDAWMNQTYHDALVDIAKYWGIPYLDLKNGELVPMMNNGRLMTTCQTTKDLRDGAFCISSSNAHPTPKAHEYRSTVIENFLRTL